MPHLNQLTLDAKGIYPDDLVTFLAQLPHLGCLNISVSSTMSGDLHSQWHAHKPTKNVVYTLPLLWSLSANAAYAATILGHRLPSLQITSVDIDESNGPGLFSSETRRHLSTILSRAVPFQEEIWLRKSPSLHCRIATEYIFTILDHLN
ncbi:hypothetical protein DXG01_015426, partial [Tephrocybe rancida]